MNIGMRRSGSMYGASTADPVVRWYDVSFGVGSPAELEWHLAKARQFGGPVLDLACGTGRLALRLAEAGFEVHALDASAGMLAQLRAKLASLAGEVRDRMTIAQAPMAGFELGRAFRTIVCCDAFFHNLTVAEEIACLERVRAHLEPEGRFVFNLPNPTCEFILAAERSAGREFGERGRYALPDGGTLVVEHAQSADRVNQRIATTLRVNRLDGAGELVETGESRWESRYLYRWEAVHLLERSGLRVEELVGDYEGRPVGPKGQLIFVARRVG